jgi:hypothetical protein
MNGKREIKAKRTNKSRKNMEKTRRYRPEVYLLFFGFWS